MADDPHRVQLSRRKGWRMPENTVSVARPGPFGNPFVVGKATDANGVTLSLGGCVAAFRSHVCSRRDWSTKIEALRGKNLACWCPLDKPCHADVLLELANKEPRP